MFKFIFENSKNIDEFIYILCGIVSIMVGIRALKNKKSPIGTCAFWVILGILFAGGKFIINSFTQGGAFLGFLIMILGCLTLTNQVSMGEFEPVPDEERIRNGKKVGHWIWIPALGIGFIAMFLAKIKVFKIVVGYAENNAPIYFNFTSAQVLGLTALISVLIAALMTGAKYKETKEDTIKMVMQIGSSSLLPQLLGALGTVFAAAGVGDIIGQGVAAIVPPHAKVFGVIAYCLGMVVFTMIMGNAFAAFTVITIGVGIPFVIANGGDPAIIGALGMTCGYCGTLITPMAANFNIVPGAILETKNKYTIMKVQAPFAIVFIALHVVLMLVFGF